MKVKINSVNIEDVVKGKSRYSVATVEYDFKGEPRTQKIMKFANPSVFRILHDNQYLLVGQEVDVTLAKNAQGYTEWSALVIPDFTPVPAPAKAAGTVTRVGGSNFETPEERAKKQVYIIKQSSITAAISILTAEQLPVTVDEVKKIAQELTDFVLGNDAKAKGSGFDDMGGDIPY